MSDWHRPGDLPVDRAREVARTCWEALRRVDPEAADLIAQAAAAVGEQWLAPEISRHTLDDVVSVVEAAHLVGRSARWGYQWVAERRGDRAVIGSDGLIKVRVRQLLEDVAQERRKPKSPSAPPAPAAQGRQQARPTRPDDGHDPSTAARRQEDLARMFDSLDERDLAAKQREIAESLRDGEPP